MVMNVQTNSNTHALNNIDEESELQSLTEVTHLIERGVYIPSTKYRTESSEDTIPYVRVGDMQGGTKSRHDLAYVVAS
jgi:hypothetical protein